MELEKDEYISHFTQKYFIIFTEKKVTKLFREEFTWHTVLKLLDKPTKVIY